MQYSRIEAQCVEKAVVYDADESPAHSVGAGSNRRWPDSNAAEHRQKLGKEDMSLTREPR